MDELTGEVWQRLLPADPVEVGRWLESLPQPVKATYEAGPTGYGLARFLWSRGITCSVAAPSKLQRPVGNRIKTDARDAEQLWRLLRLGEIVEVALPDVQQEAARDLVRAREDVRGDLMRVRHRVTHLLLRQGIVYGGGKSWTAAHQRWLRTQRFDAPARQLVFEDAVEAVVLMTDRRDRLDKAIEAMAADSSYTLLVRRLCCLRGISTLTGFGLAVEIGDWRRFTGSSIGAFLGLVESVRWSVYGVTAETEVTDVIPDLGGENRDVNTDLPVRVGRARSGACLAERGGGHRRAAGVGR